MSAEVCEACGKAECLAEKYDVRWSCMARHLRLARLDLRKLQSHFDHVAKLTRRTWAAFESPPPLDPPKTDMGKHWSAKDKKAKTGAAEAPKTAAT